MKKIKSKKLPKNKKLQFKKSKINPKYSVEQTDFLNNLKVYLEKTIKNEITVRLDFVTIPLQNIEYFGILKFPSKIPRYQALDLIFQFNPLNQWKYKTKEKAKEKLQPIKRTSKEPEFIDYGSEFDILAQIESQFENDEPTYEWRFISSEIYSVDTETNSIEFYSDVIFKPKMIDNFSLFAH